VNVLTEGDNRMPTTRERVVHASVLLDFDGAKILTAPWFSERPL
jgi:L-ascorbate metabolism protein UlaG (beta-lactamase superfamily)